MKRLLGNRVLRYLTSGILTVIVENGTFLVLYYVLSITPALANITSIIIALVFNFYMTKFFVFSNRADNKKAFGMQAAKYLILAAFNLTISTTIVVGLIHLGMPGYAAKFIATACIAAWTYIIYRTLIFKDKDSQGGQSPLH